MKIELELDMNEVIEATNYLDVLLDNSDNFAGYSQITRESIAKIFSQLYKFELSKTMHKEVGTWK